MASSQAAPASALLGRAETAWAAGDLDSAVAWFDRAAAAAEEAGDLATQVAAVLGLARGQRYNVTPGRLPVRLHGAYDVAVVPEDRARLAAALARCWAYANEPGRAIRFAEESLALAEPLGDAQVLADALDAALAAHWGPDGVAARREWAVQLDDVAAHLRDPEARLQAALWGLTVAWEVLDLPRIHRSMRAVEVLAEESPRARFFAASRRLVLELLRGNHAVATTLVEQAEAAAAGASIPDAFGVLHGMRGYTAFFGGDAATCAAEAPVFEEHAEEYGVTAVRAEAAVMWLGAGRADKVAEMVGAFTPEVVASLPRDGDWLLTLQCVLEGALAVEDRDVVANVTDLLVPYAGRSVVNAGAVMWHGVTDDTLARAHALLGDHESAERHRGAALATYERVGARWWRSRLLAEAGARPPVSAALRPRTAHLHEQPGGLWLVGTSGHTGVLPAMRGLKHLHSLLLSPGGEISVLALAGAGESVHQPGLELLDDTARRAYRARLDVIDRELELTDRPDLHSERDAIAAELRAAEGLGGRARRPGSSEERARVAVRKAVIAALARIAEIDPWLGRHLHQRVRTGATCSYLPDPDDPVSWVLE